MISSLPVNLLHLLSSAAMHDSPSSPRRSIAPAPPKQPQAKKAGAPKAKGAVRAKSGCYTCRIRRKVNIPSTTTHTHTHTLSVSLPPPSVVPHSLYSCTHSLSFRNVMNDQTQRVDARPASVSAFSALALGRSAQNGSRYAPRVDVLHVLSSPFS